MYLETELQIIAAESMSCRHGTFPIGVRQPPNLAQLSAWQLRLQELPPRHRSCVHSVEMLLKAAIFPPGNVVLLRCVHCAGGYKEMSSIFADQ